MIYIKDETANIVVLTIDNNGNMAFGDGTPISLLTINNYGIIDSGGYIVHGLGSCSVNGLSGAVNVGVNQAVGISTVTGRVPTVQLDTLYPAISVQYVPDDGSGNIRNTQNLVGVPMHSKQPVFGGFVIRNQNSVSSEFTDPSSIYYDSTFETQEVSYRWI